jgi:hypothetical protein
LTLFDSAKAFGVHAIPSSDSTEGDWRLGHILYSTTFYFSRCPIALARKLNLKQKLEDLINRYEVIIDLKY